jgi:hypothetical protein
MKTLTAIAALAFSFVTVTQGQAQSGMAIENWKNIKVGAMLTAGGATSAGPVATGTKTSPGFALSGGALAIFPFSPNIGFDLAVCYDSRMVSFHDEANTSNGVDISAGYLSIRPGFNLGGFTIGLGIGLPMSVSVAQNTPPNHNFPFVPSASSSDMTMLLEGRIGGSIPIMQTDKAELRFLIEGAYGFSPIFSSDFVTKNGGTDNTKNNGPLATLQLGFAYLFDTNPH